jgi:CRP-like cAMP-binding protein
MPAMASLADLRAQADVLLYNGKYPDALHVYCALLELSPTSLDVRLRIADALLAAGELQRAAVVYTVLARHATHAGHPLRAIVALKILASLEPLLESMLQGLGQLYGCESPCLGRGARIAAADESRPVPPGFRLTQMPELPQLYERAAALGADLSQAGGIYPEKLPPVPLLSELPAEAFGRVLAALKLCRARPADVIVREGEAGQSFFVLARGRVRVTRGEQVLTTLHDGAIFGEMALVNASARTASVIAESDCDLLEFDRDALAAVAQNVVQVAQALDKFMRERLLNTLIANAPIFRPLERSQRVDLVKRFTAHDVAAGVRIIQEGSAGQGLYLLLAGEVAVTKGEGADAVELARLHPGEIFGEMSLVDDQPVSASVTAASQTTVLFLAREVFDRLVVAVPEIGEYLRGLGEARAMDTRLLLDAARWDEELQDEDLVPL